MQRNFAEIGAALLWSSDEGQQKLCIQFSVIGKQSYPQSVFLFNILMEYNCYSTVRIVYDCA